MFTGKFVLICEYIFTSLNREIRFVGFLAAHFKGNYFRRELVHSPKMVATYQEKLLCCLLMCQTKHEKHLPFALNIVYLVTADIDE